MTHPHDPRVIPTNGDSVERRLWSRIDKGTSSGCWLWTARKTAKGYAVLDVGRKAVAVHRLVYQLTIGPIPEGLTLDHLCRVRHCVNPAHLEPVTSAENTKRGMSGVYQTAKTHCPHGHEYTPENTRRYRGKRECRSCDRERSRLRRTENTIDGARA